MVVSEQQVISLAVLPFFLALHPPLATDPAGPSLLQTTSWKHLYALYSNHPKSPGVYGAWLIRILMACLKMGGARMHEEVLQNGALHVLASSLRLGLIRATKLKLLGRSSSEQTPLSLDDFL